MKPTRRPFSRPITGLLVITLIGTAYFVFRDYFVSDAGQAETAKGQGRPSVARSNTPTAPALPAPTVTANGAVNLFPRQSWRTVPPLPEFETEPESTDLPPLPFRVIGILKNGKTRYIALTADASDTFLVCTRCAPVLGRIQVGDTVLDTYRLEEINSTTLVFTYLPLKQKQTLFIGETL